MIDVSKVLANLMIEISHTEKDTKSTRLDFLQKVGEDGVFKVETSKPLEGEYIFSSKETKDITVSISRVEGNVYISGINTEHTLIKTATVQKDEATLSRAVASKLEGLKEGEDIIKDPVFIVGPPGTGKTTAITKIVERALALGKRVLVVSPTNKAIESFGERCKFEAMGLKFGEAVFAINTEKEILQTMGPKAIAESKLKPINMELSLLEPALDELSRTKRDADTIIAALAGEEDATAIMLSNIQHDIARASETLKKAKLTLREHQEMEAMLNSNQMIHKFAGAFLGAKMIQLEADLAISKTAVEVGEAEIARLEEKRVTAAEDRSRAIAKLEEGKALIAESDNNRRELEERIAELKKEKEEVASLNLYNKAKLVGTTLMGASLKEVINKAEFDLIIVDEASMASLPLLLLACKAVKKNDDREIVPPMEYDEKELYPAQANAVNMAINSQFIFVGDPKQLSPIAKTPDMRISVFEVYDIERMFDGDDVSNACLLNINHRNHPDIVKLTSDLFYGGLLKSGKPHDGKKSLYIRNIKSPCVRYNDSYVNHGSANVVREQTCSALEKGRRSIGVITPYREQANNINIILRQLKDSFSDADMEAGTVHRFQGKEKKVILFDITSSSGTSLPATYVGGMKSEAARLLNVAMTRAEDFFVLVGDVSGLANQLRTIDGHENMAIYRWLVGIMELAFAKKEEAVEVANAA